MIHPSLIEIKKATIHDKRKQTKSEVLQKIAEGQESSQQLLRGFQHQVNEYYDF